jgi:ABC-type transport system involved in multi-copper enzyme maturation permease subunit
MVIALITNRFNPRKGFASASAPLVWKAWQESRGRFFSALVLLVSLVVYAVVTSPGFLVRYNAHFPDKPLIYSAYVWTGLFHYALQGLWVLAAFVVTMGGLRREKATGVALFTLGLPVTRLHLFIVRAAMAWAESIVLGLVSALLIPVLSSFVGESYPFVQALAFGALMSVAGLVILAFGLLLSELFEGEFTAPVVGLCTLTTIFLGYKAHTLRGWNVFDVMSATTCIDPATQLLTRTVPWLGLAICLLVSFGLLLGASVTIRARDL